MSNKPIEVITYKGINIEIYSDQTPLNPRAEWDNAGKMVCWHRNYALGESHDYSAPVDFFMQVVAGNDPGIREMYEDIKINDREIINIINKNLGYKYVYWLPLYLYDHSGITMSTAPFSCQWDSGCVGYIYISKEQAAKEWPEKTEEQILDVLKDEVKTYDQYISGEVFEYRIEAIGGQCSGFFGYDHKESGLLEYAKSEIDRYIRSTVQQHNKRVKNWIINKIPLIYRKPLSFS